MRIDKKEKERMGPNQVQFVTYVDWAILKEFDKHVGKGNRSKMVRQLMETYNRMKREVS